MDHRLACREELKIIDNSITAILNKATKTVEGPNCNIPFSEIKEVKRAALLYWKMKLKQYNCQNVTYKIMEKRWRIAGILIIYKLTEQQVKEYYEQVKKEWDQLKIEGYKIREEELLDYNKEELENDTIV